MKALCPPKVVPGLRSTGSPRIPRELSGTDGKGKNRDEEGGRVTALLPGRMKSRQGCGDTSARDPRGVGDKAVRGRKGKKVRGDIFWMGVYTWEGDNETG